MANKGASTWGLGRGGEGSIQTTELRAPALHRAAPWCGQGRPLTCQIGCPGRLFPAWKREGVCEPFLPRRGAGPPPSLVSTPSVGVEPERHPLGTPLQAGDQAASPRLPETGAHLCTGHLSPGLGPPVGPGGEGHLPPQEAAVIPREQEAQASGEGAGVASQRVAPAPNRH